MKTARLALAALALAAIGSTAQAADPVEGLWLVQSGTAKVRIAPCTTNRTLMCGTVAWLKTPNDKAGQPLKDANNPDAGQRGKPILGLNMIRDFKASGAGRWTGGKIYDPGAGKTYGSKMSLNPEGTLKVEGCIAMICQAQTWKRTS